MAELVVSRDQALALNLAFRIREVASRLSIMNSGEGPHVGEPTLDAMGRAIDAVLLAPKDTQQITAWHFSERLLSWYSVTLFDLLSWIISLIFGERPTPATVPTEG